MRKTMSSGAPTKEDTLPVPPPPPDGWSGVYNAASMDAPTKEDTEAPKKETEDKGRAEKEKGLATADQVSSQIALPKGDAETLKRKRRRRRHARKLLSRP